MWRIKVLTEKFGPCGYGWKYEILDQRLEKGAKDEIAAFVTINLFVHFGDMGWSEAIPGIGGSMFVSQEKSGPYTSDECFKMALTDAISVSCKALGVAADVYWDKDQTKYEAPKQEVKATPTNEVKKISDKQLKRLFAIAKGKETLAKEVVSRFGYESSKDIMSTDYEAIVSKLQELVGA
jgi:hypothetical protein